VFLQRLVIHEYRRMAQTIHYFLLCQAAVFIVGALVHFGVLTHGYEHLKADIAETVVATVLMLSVVWMWIRPALTRTAGLGVALQPILTPDDCG